MKKLELNQMESLEGSGAARKCLIDGVLTFNIGIGLGILTGGWGGGAVAFLGGLYSANANGCFDN